MTDRDRSRDLALQLAVIKVLGDLIKSARTAADATADEVLEPGDRIVATFPGGAKVATVSMTEGSVRSRVTDADKLAAWVAEKHPTEVETVTRVRSGYLKALQDRAKRDGAAVDPDTGEVIPGLEVYAGDPHPSVRLAPDAVAIVADAWRTGTLPLDGVLAIGEGSDSGE